MISCMKEGTWDGERTAVQQIWLFALSVDRWFWTDKCCRQIIKKLLEFWQFSFCQHYSASSPLSSSSSAFLQMCPVPSSSSWCVDKNYGFVLLEFEISFLLLQQLQFAYANQVSWPVITILYQPLQWNRKKIMQIKKFIDAEIFHSVLQRLN